MSGAIGLLTSGTAVSPGCWLVCGQSLGSIARAFWFPFELLRQLLSDPVGTSFVLGGLAWGAIVALSAGLVLWLRWRGTAPLLVLAGIIALYSAMALLSLLRRVSPHTIVAAVGLGASVLSLAVVSLGIVRSTSNRTAAVLMLPLNGLFLLGFLILTELAMRA